MALAKHSKGLSTAELLVAGSPNTRAQGKERRAASHALTNFVLL